MGTTLSCLVNAFPAEPFCLLLLALNHILAISAEMQYALLHSSIVNSLRQLCRFNLLSAK